jgi:hypothetical protein
VKLDGRSALNSLSSRVSTGSGENSAAVACAHPRQPFAVESSFMAASLGVM